MSWIVLEKLLTETQINATLSGKYWIIIMFIFRIIVVLSVGERVYGDEQSRFICNTMQPGCDNVCYNRFSPISHIRFWAIQILFACLPSITFIVWAMHSLNIVHMKKKKSEDRNGNVPKKVERSTNTYSVLQRNHNPKIDDPSPYQQLSPPKVVSVEEVLPEKRTKKISNPPILKGYMIQLFCRMVIEITFFAVQYHLYQFYVPDRFLCNVYPCPLEVECFVSRPQEKNIFLIFMYIMTGISIIMDFSELHFFAIKKMSGQDKYISKFKEQWYTDPVLAKRFDILGNRSIIERRRRDMDIDGDGQSDNGGDYDVAFETSDEEDGCTLDTCSQGYADSYDFSDFPEDVDLWDEE